jgi:dUTP pyrophosphatase
MSPVPVRAEPVRLEIVRLDPGLALPAYARPGDAGLDLGAARDISLAPGERQLVPTGLRIAVPEGYAGLILPRSGLALRDGVTVLNAPGLIDAGYRGEQGVLLLRRGQGEGSAYWFRRRLRKPSRPWGMKMTMAMKMRPTGIR